MATSGVISSLIDSLSNSEDKQKTLSELATLITATSPAVLAEVSPNVSFDVLFDCLNTTDKDQLSSCIRILDALMGILNPSVLVQEFRAQLLGGLAHRSDAVRQLTLKQVSRATEFESLLVGSDVDIVSNLITNIGHESLSVTKEANKILIKIAENNEALGLIFQPSLLEHLRSVSNQDDVIRFRVYELIVTIASQSEAALDLCEKSGFLERLLAEVYVDDVLLQLNCLELLKDLAQTEHGLKYLETLGLINHLNEMLAKSSEDALLGFLLPGLIKFFGCVLYLHPDELSSERFKMFSSLLFDFANSNETSLSCIAVETVAVIGRTTRGKLALAKQGSRMMEACRAIGDLIKSSVHEFRVKSLHSLISIIHIPVLEQNDDLVGISEQWFNHICPQPLDMIMSLVTQPFLDVRCLALNVLQTISLTKWGQTRLNARPGFNEYLLDRSKKKKVPTATLR